ncbi:formamidopyrimidine-DNA glycosylase [Corynebacterium kutscheri]|uniref:Formamidopyrimidine-DNA glycosylase n=1 Tax=Corynebacterium kutscheri TaxID=35755 RepID=A0AB38VTD6_9CORY|nr:bifunctional DNA-formamidopyrimidine glycosylase/DNA-(apurinic or apyrimidinic site) lyase [Corynebacterium kutscheri]VEH08777.1 formamidopyrimidine-DNA glycosylase [Corynebacterium kutscheri]VEH79906.1 formamidopyrimidine-DNA glycosylase [Corynebacterium kutscheri]
MPELPEVEVVRRGLTEHLVHRRIEEVTVHHPRAVRSIIGGEAELQARLVGRKISAMDRRGKFLWAVLDDDTCLLVHLGMSGQMLIKQPDSKDARTHLRIQAQLSDGNQLWFVDQRTFGYWWIGELSDTLDGVVPENITHIARDLMDPQLNIRRLAIQLKNRRTTIKSLLLNQEIVAGIGNIYADEMLWAAQVHPRNKANQLSLKRIEELLVAGRLVMAKALEQGGTSFDALYVDVNGNSGYFDLSLKAYGQTDKPCSRCGGLIIREKFHNRSSHLCPRCQRLH